MGKSITSLRDFPSVEELLQHSQLATAVANLPRPVAANVIRATIQKAKDAFQKARKQITEAAFIKQVNVDLRCAKRNELTRVINAAGIVVHTNLGRSPLNPDLLNEIVNSVTGYSNIEFNLATGKRGSRGAACEEYLATLAESEAATVVNNNAAALHLILNTLANRKEVIVSRGELVQIGGGFRIPDILRRSGARLCEVGATNVTTLDDYASAITDRTGLILKVHQSNFAQVGFVGGVSLKELVGLARHHEIPVLDDLGSGVFVDTKSVTGFTEPTVPHSVRAGADLTCFSGDKLLGGVQAGLIVGRADLVKRIKRNPLFRTVRVDKLIFAMLERVLGWYLNSTSAEYIRLWQLLSVPEADLYQKGKDILAKIGSPAGVSVEATKAYVGGGSLPDADIPSVAICFSDSYKATRLECAFRDLDVPIIGRIEQERFFLDLKAVLPEDYPVLITSLGVVVAKYGGHES